MNEAQLHTPESLRARSEAVSAGLPALLADAQKLTATVLLGEHGRKRAGLGDEFWQYRAARAGDSLRAIDWRRSARSDGHFVRQTEWQAAQAVMIGVDQAQSMSYSGARDRPSKLRRAQTLALALAGLAVRGGERVGLTHLAEPPRGGQAQLLHLAEALLISEDPADYGTPAPQILPEGCRAVFFSDFLGDLEALRTALGRASDRGVRGALVQVLDPDEESFPFDGRTLFESMSGALRFETLKAGGLRAAYQARLAARRAELKDLARKSGWQLLQHHSGESAEPALLWLYRALERKGRL